MKVIGWSAWYADGSVYDSRNIAWCDLPDDGVVTIYLYKDGGYRESMNGHDFYFNVGDVYGYNDHPREETEVRYPGVCIKRGKWVSSQEFARIERDALAYKWADE